MKEDLRASDVGVLIKDVKKRDAAARVKAFALVQLAACLERFVKDMVVVLHSELNRRRLDLGKVKKTLLCVVHNGRFETLRQTTGSTNWDARVSLFENIYVGEDDSFCVNVSPLDGGTLRRTHFNMLWAVYGFSGDALPSSKHVVALESLADLRNDIAHGNQSATTIGRIKTTKDIQSLTDKIEDIAIHLASCIEDYLNRDSYLDITLH